MIVAGSASRDPSLSHILPGGSSSGFGWEGVGVDRRRGPQDVGTPDMFLTSPNMTVGPDLPLIRFLPCKCGRVGLYCVCRPTGASGSVHDDAPHGPNGSGDGEHLRRSGGSL